MKTTPKITPQVAQMVDNDEAIAYWNSLPETTRRGYYDDGVADVRHSQWTEARNGSFVSGHTGKGAGLATAIDSAWNDGPVMQERRQAARDAYRNEGLRKDLDAWRKGCAHVNGEDFPLADCPAFIRDIAEGNARRAAEIFGEAF